MSEHSRRSTVKILRAIIYARVSKDDSKKGRSPEEQIEECTADCEHEGWQIAEVLSDNDRGASRHTKRERENWNRLPDILRRGDVLVVWEPSRITRDMKVFGSFCDLLASRGVLLYYDDRLYDMNDDDDRNVVWQDILDGAKQVAKTRKRVIRAMKKNVKDGKPHGKKAPGYRIVRDEDGKSQGWEPDPRQVAVLQKAADRVLQDRPGSMSRLAAELELQWRAAGGRGAFAGRDLTRFLTSPTTFGLRVVGDTTKTGTWVPALNPELYKPLRALLLEPSRLTHRGSDTRWLLTYIARCSVCVAKGDRGVIDHKGPSEKFRKSDAYVCREFNHVTRNMLRVDDYVQEFLLRWLEHPEVLAKLTARNEIDRVAIDADLATIDELQAEIKAYVRDAAKNRRPSYAVTPYVDELESQIQAARSRVDAMAVAVDPDVLDALGPDARAKWKRRTIEQRRNTIRATMTVTITPVERRGRYGEIGVEVRPLRMLA
jgi:site-specific DNA recombinase